MFQKSQNRIVKALCPACGEPALWTQSTLLASGPKIHIPTALTIWGCSHVTNLHRFVEIVVTEVLIEHVCDSHEDKETYHSTSYGKQDCASHSHRHAM